MLRFPNPGSTIWNFISVYAAAFEKLSGYAFDLDDFVWAVVAANLATSSGYMGEEAVARSTREDRSRDPLYNQLKMYAELLRALGWLHPTEESSLNYVFTLLGRQVIAAGSNYMPLFRESVLGIVHPTRTLKVKGNFNLRPFAFLLKVMSEAGGFISRDEMIIGPLNITSDRDSDSVAKVVSVIKEARSSKTTMVGRLKAVAEESDTQVNTLYNYTRWPIAVLRDCGWATKGTAAYDNGKTFEAFHLTTRGRTTAEWLQGAADVRLDQAETLPADERSAVSLEGHYGMLGRSQFDLTPILPTLAATREAAFSARQRLRLKGTGDLLFSPMQTLSIADIATIFEVEKPQQFSQEVREHVKSTATGRGSRDHLFVTPLFVTSVRHVDDQAATEVRQEIASLLARYGSVERAADAFCSTHAHDTQVAFYPLVSYLFRVLNYQSAFSRAGVNYQRWDACVWIGSAAIPVEIKSPTEEEFLSTKAVRQALENKIVLLSRGGLNTRPDLTSLIVGFRIPNERGEMSSLIDDVYKTYGLAIGVIDLRSLFILAARSVTEGITIAPEQLGSLRGFLHV